MTRKTAVRIERDLRARGVYKPYVSADTEGRVFVESYPLTATVTHAATVDPEMGPFDNIKVTDCSLARIGLDNVLTVARVFLGQPVFQRVGELLLAFHEHSFARALEQDTAAGVR